MGLSDWLMALGLVVFAGASFFFALAESALFALGKWRARQLAGQPAGARVTRLLEQPSELLATLVLGNTVSNGALVALALWPALNGRMSPALALFCVAMLILIGCEVLPKALAVRAPEPWALRVARPMTAVLKLTGWLERLLQRLNEWLLRLLVRGQLKPLPTVADEEYKELVELAAQQGALAQSEKEIILQILNLDRKTARDVMRPRSQMAAVSDDLSVEDMLEAARQSRHLRLPIYDETPDTIVGVLNTQVLLLDPDASLEDAIEFPSFVPETMNLLQLLKSLERQQRGLAVVRDEFGGTAGIVTVEDILGEVVGRMPEESAAAGLEVETLGPGRWRVPGRTRVGEFRRECPELGEVTQVDTVGGLLVSLLEVVPAAGESAVFRGLRLTAQAVDERRVKEVLVEVTGEEIPLMTTSTLLLFLASVAVSFFMSGMEAGVFALNRLRIRHWMRAGNARAARLHGYLEKPENFLWTILVGNTLANLAVVSIGVMWLHRWLRSHPWLLLATLVAGILMFYAMCELLPKMIFRLYPNRLCLALATPFGLLHGCLRPVVAPVAVFARWLLSWTGGRSFTGHLFGNRDELRVFMRESAQGLSNEERAMISRVLDLQNLAVRQITTPFDQAVTVESTTPIHEVLALVRERGHTRLPVWRAEGGRRRIAGVLSVRSLLYQGPVDASKTAGDHVRPLLYLDADVRLETALRMMQRSGHRLAIVLGPDRRETGIVGLQDILRVIFGDVKL